MWHWIKRTMHFPILSCLKSCEPRTLISCNAWTHDKTTRPVGIEVSNVPLPLPFSANGRSVWRLESNAMQRNRTPWEWNVRMYVSTDVQFMSSYTPICHVLFLPFWSRGFLKRSNLHGGDWLFPPWSQWKSPLFLQIGFSREPWIRPSWGCWSRRWRGDT